MPLTYSYGAQLNSNPVDFIRFCLGDKNPEGWLLADEEIASLVTAFGSQEAAVLPACDAAIATAIHIVTVTQGEVTQAWKERRDGLIELRQRLATRFPEPGGCGQPQVAHIRHDYRRDGYEEMFRWPS